MADDKSKSISRAVKRTELKVIHMYLGGSAENQAPVGGGWWYASAILPPSGTVRLSGGGLTPRTNLNWDFAEREGKPWPNEEQSDRKLDSLLNDLT